MKLYLRSLFLLLLFASVATMGQTKYGTQTNKKDISFILQSQGYTEVVSERTETSKTFEHSSGSRAAYQANMPIHYLNNEGKWVDAERTLTYDKATNKVGIWKQKFPFALDLGTGGLEMTMDKGTMHRGQGFRFTQLDAQGKVLENTIGLIGEHQYNQKDQVTFQNIFANTDLRFDLDVVRNSTNYVIKQKPNFSNGAVTYAYTEEISLPKGYNVVPDLENGDKTNLGWQGPLLVVDEKGTAVAVFNTALYYDNARNEVVGTYVVEELEGGKFLLSVLVSTQWLNDANRVYPVTLDPSVSLTSTATIVTCYAPAYQASTLAVSVPSGNTVGKSYFETDFVAQGSGWTSEQRHYIEGPTTSSAVFAGGSNSTGIVYWSGFLDIANGYVSPGTVTYTWYTQRTYGSGTCNTTYNYVSFRGMVVFYGPCPNDNVAYNTTPLNITCTPATESVGRGEYVRYNVVNGVTYEFSTCASPAGFDTELSGYNQSSGAALFYNDDFGPVCPTSDKASVQWNATFSGVARVLVDNFSTSTFTNCIGDQAGGPGSAVLAYRQLTTVNNTTNTASICVGGSKPLTATLVAPHNNPTIVWSIASGGGSITSSTYNSGTYTGSVTIRATVGACTSDKVFTVYALPSAAISGTTTSCASNGTTFTASGGGTYLWSTGATSAAIAVGSSGTYTVTVTTNGCSATASRTATIYTDPTITLTGNNQTICSGASATAFTASISGGSGCAYQWQSSIDGNTWSDISGATGTSYTPTGVTNSTFYRCRTRNCIAGCDEATSQVRYVAVTAVATVQTHPTPTSQSVCAGNNVVYNAQANIGSGTTRYRLVLLSAHGANWHGIQEIRGYNAAGVEQTLSCLGASSTTYSSDLCGSASYGAGNAFDGAYPVSNSPTSTAQWLTPAQSTAAGSPNTNWQNYATVNPFYSPEWIEWSSPQPLSSIWVYNGRYDVGNTATCFKDYNILVSYNNGATWSTVKSGAFNAAPGLDGTNNMIDIEPDYTWKRGTTTVGTGKSLSLNSVTTGNSGTYTVQMTYGCATTTSNNAVLTVGDQPTITISGTAGICYNTSTTLTATASGGAGTCSYQWQYFNGTSWVNTGSNAATLSTGALTVSRIYRCLRSCTGTGCATPVSNEFTVTVDAAPVAATAPTSTVACPGDNVTLTADFTPGIDWKDPNNWNFSGNITWDAGQQAWRCQGYCNMYLKSTVAPAIDPTKSYNIEVDVLRTVSNGKIFYWGGDRLNSSYAHLNGYGGTYDYSAASAQSPPVGEWKTYQKIGKTGTAASADGWGNGADATAYYRVGGLINYSGSSSEVTYIRNIKFYYDDVHLIIDNPITYQWQKDGNNVSGATSTSLTLTGVTAANAGTYTLNATNACGTATSAPAVVIVNPVPTTPSIAVTSGSTTGCGSINATFEASSSIAGNALNLNGTSSYSLGNPSELQITGNMTIEMWLRPTSFSQRRNPWGKAYGGEGTITQETNGTLNFYWGTGAGNAAPYTSLNSATALTLNQWNHVAVVRDMTNNTVSWYINGVLTNSMVPPYSGSVSSLSASIGQNYTGQGYLGQIDELRVWNVARTQAQVQANMNSIVTAFQANLAGYWRMDETTGNITDASGTNMVSVPAGAPTFITSTAPIEPNYTWSPGTQLNTTVGSTVTSTATASRTYTVTATSPVGCNTSTANIAVTVNPIPTASISGTNTICAGGSSTFTASGGGTYAWSTGASTASISVSTAGTYTVTVTNNGCTATASRTLNVTALPSASISGTNTICAGGSSTFTASGGGTYAWSTGASTASISVSTAGTYTVTVTTSGCSATASRTLTVTPLPTPTISGTNTICAGGSSTFTANGGGTYAWSTGASTASISVSTAGTYTVTVTTSGCSATASRTLNVTALPSASISGTNTICAGGSSTFTATGGGTYAWSTGASTAAISVSTAGTYTVTVTTNGCSATASRLLTVNALPSVSITPVSPSICNGESTTLTASGGTTYNWSTGDATAAISVSPASTASYTVTVTDGNTCTATASKSVTVTQLVIGSQTFQSGDYVFSGATTAAWGTASNWYMYNGSSFDPATVVPASTSNVFIYPSATHTCIVRSTVNLSGTNNAKDVNIKSGAGINGTTNTRTINVYGNWTNEGTFTMGNSIVAFRGSANTTASAGGSNFYNLTINKTTNAATVQFLEDFTCALEFLVTRGTAQVPQDITGKALNTTVDANGTIILKQKTSGTKGGELRTEP